MELIVAVYDDWGIGCCGTQPVALSADRKFFRETTKGAMVIVGRKTLGDFPGGKPLPGRTNVVLSRGIWICPVLRWSIVLKKLWNWPRRQKRPWLSAAAASIS